MASLFDGHVSCRENNKNQPRSVCLRAGFLVMPGGHAQVVDKGREEERGNKNNDKDRNRCQQVLET